ncbi:MAG: hypothetical protein HOP28_05785 [Gemmatimonadales bacterium]|nr:hypothetical protein [Gemmatimonadales bacterium]
MSRISTLVILASLGGLSNAAARQRPDFAGEWTLADTADRRPSVASQGDASFGTGSMGSGWGSPIVITQQSNQLTVSYTFFSAYDLQPPLRFVYALDGSESRNTVMIGHASSEQRSRAVWQGAALVITTLHTAPAIGGGPARVAEVRQVLTLESPDRLVVETVRAGIQGAATTTTRTVYTKRR